MRTAFVVKGFGCLQWTILKFSLIGLCLLQLPPLDLQVCQKRYLVKTKSLLNSYGFSRVLTWSLTLISICLRDSKYDSAF